ncbi:Glu/Leu/Phe/Val dehydrogenase [Patescibacteria group bacterium]|nr:Glu/Leu/Phe/Val dehydrogenase [Patescibacteria group bacterium]MBU1727837.1 Glu/Leu/Phe/Val dehydrogenase [Patescibacteria group bacterium]
MQNPFQNAMSQLDKVANIKNFGEEFIARLRHPDRDIRISIPVKMDNGQLKIFEGYRVEYNNVLGPYKGGIRYHQDTEINEVKALAFWMALKCAVAGIPMGGGKGGITVNPRELSKGELERLSRGWIQKLSDILGPMKDVPAPDVNTTPEIMDWMADEFEKITGDKTRAVITGKPLGKGGSEGRGTATAQGGFFVFESLKKDINLPEKCKVAVQGFGNAGSYAALIWKKAGHNVVTVSDSKGGIYNPDGLDIEKLMEYKKTTGSLSGFPESKEITNEEVLQTECDLLIPAAFENQITAENADKIKAKAILELANGPITPEADEILFKKGVSVIPDILANSGGVTVSYFEWDQNLKNEHWSEKEVFDKLQPILDDSAKKILVKSKESNTDLRRGAFILALERIQEKM